MVEQALGLYLESLSSELKASQDRVRHLIGDAHWPSDGRHKEALFRGVLSRYLPYGCLAASGFVIDVATGGLSTEQDILVVDTLVEAPIFNEFGLVVASPATIVASVSVKTKLNRNELASTLEGLESVRAICRRNAYTPWLGGLFYSRALGPDAVLKQIKSFLCETTSKSLWPLQPENRADFRVGPHAIATADRDLWRVDRIESPGALPEVTGFATHGLSAAVFIACIARHIALRRDTRSISGIADYLANGEFTRHPAPKA